MPSPDITLFHNPRCSTSRNALATIREAGCEPTVVEYFSAGWRREQLSDLLARMGARPRDILRTKEPLAAELGLTDPGASDDAILDAMVAHPVLVERPILATPKGVALCRPVERVNALL